jgi:nucleotide-binding universal stress UspA family protein
MYKNIIVPLDGSNLAEKALPYAEKLAGYLGSDVTLIHVSETEEDTYDYMHQAYLEALADTTSQGAERYRKKAKKRRSWSTQFIWLATLPNKLLTTLTRIKVAS